MSNNPSRCLGCETLTNELEHGRCLSCRPKCPKCSWELLPAGDGSVLYCDNLTCHYYRVPYTREEMDRRIERATINGAVR